MPPEDTIFEDSNATAGAAQTTVTEATPDTPDTPAPLAADQVSEMLDERLAPITQSIQSMGSFFEQLQNRVADTPIAGAEPATNEDWSTKFYNDPQATIQAEFQEQAAGVIGPTAETLGDLVIENQRTIVDNQWGEGAWEEVFQPSLGPVINEAKRTNPAQLLNKAAIENAVATVTGRNVDALVARRAATTESKTAEESQKVEQLAQAVLSRTNLQGGIRRTNGDGPPKLGPEHNEVLEAMQRDTGETPDPQLLAVLMNTGDDTGTTLEQWQSATKKESK